MYFRVAPHDSGNILVVIIEHSVVFLSFIEFVSIFELALLHGPWVPLDGDIKTHKHIYDNIFIFVAHFVTFYDGLA